jgi:hypothetical protein
MEGSGEVVGVVTEGVVGLVSPTRRALTPVSGFDTLSEEAVVRAPALSYDDVTAEAAELFPGAAAGPARHGAGSDGGGLGESAPEGLGVVAVGGYQTSPGHAYAL